jgi:hypothetical protein
MRLQGMVGDTVTIRPAGSGWRPPEWITNPEHLKAPPSGGGAPPAAAMRSHPPPPQRQPPPPQQPPPTSTPRCRGPVAQRRGHRYLQPRPDDAACAPQVWRKTGRPDDDYDVEAGRGGGDFASDRARGDTSLRRKVIRHHQEHLRRGRSAGRRLTFWQRVCALVLSIFVGLSLLGMIATLLSTKLDALETKLETRTTNKLYPAGGDGGVGPSLSGSGSAAAGPRRRRLLDDGSPSPRRTGAQHRPAAHSDSPPATLVGLVSSVAQAVSSFIRVTSLVADEAERPMRVANVAGGVLHAARAAMARQGHVQAVSNGSSLGPVPTKEQINAASASLQLELQKLLLDVLYKRATAPVQVPPSLETAAAPLIQPPPMPEVFPYRPDVASLAVASQAPFGAGSVGGFADMSALRRAAPALFPGAAAAAAAGSSTGSAAAGPPPGAAAGAAGGSSDGRAAGAPPGAAARTPGGSSVGGAAGMAAAARATAAALTTPVAGVLHSGAQGASLPLPPPVSSAGLAPGHASIGPAHTSVAPPVAAQSAGGPGPEAIEMWALPSGKIVCRVYRACKMQDGRVLLPQWMERHSQRISSDCGLGKAGFLLENKPTPGAQFNIRHVRKNFPGGIDLSLDHAGRDVFGHAAPRDHMPHFVTDSLKPLASIEAVLGSGRGALPLTVVTPATGGGAPGTDVPAFPDMRPSLQLYEGTLNRSDADWVPSVARMFENLGFAFGPAGKEKPDEGELAAVSKTGMCFRSIVANNLKQYEPFGLFDGADQNVLFSASHLSREDPAKLPGMKGAPCTVRVTALTRTGPRALLNLAALERQIAAMGQKLGIKALFQVVDFKRDVPFEQQVSTMQASNVLVAAHGAGNANYIFMRPKSAVIEIFPFSYRAGPFNMFAKIFGLDYRYAMARPQTDVFKECMNRHERKPDIKSYAFSMWDRAVAMDKKDPGVHRLQFETEFGKPGRSEGMTTRQCVRMQELGFDIAHVASMAVESARQQCQRAMTG